MKPLLIATALLVIPAAVPTAALAQVAAGALPNTFDRPAQVATARPAAPVAVAAAPAPAPVPENAASEDTLRAIIGSAQSGAINYALMTEGLATQMRQQEAALTPIIQGFGNLVAVDFVGGQNGIDVFAVAFANASTEWLISLNDEGKVSALRFRPAE